MEEKVKKISEADRVALDAAKSKKTLALSNAEKALAQNELADLQYRYTVLQLYVKYQLKVEDALTEGGDIVYAEQKSASEVVPEVVGEKLA